jgi:hypothetical protein
VIERYILLGLRLGKHVDGFVDSYFGPPELAAEVEPEAPAPPADLAGEAAALIALVDDGALDDGGRGAYLRGQLVGLETVARRLAGERISWLEEVERCHGVHPEPVPESEFEGAHALLDETFGDTEGYQRWLADHVVPVERLLEGATVLRDEARRRSAESFDLPEGEDTHLELAANEPWAAYNYYEGGLRSRVVFNTDLPVWSHRLAHVVAHELYPGHHTEHACKEQRLVRDRGFLEETIILTGTPQSLVSEGIAELAPEVAFGEEIHERAAALLRPLGLPYDVERAEILRRVSRRMRGVGDNMAYQLNEEGRPREEVVEYGVRWLRQPRERIEKGVDFMTDPTWRAYHVCYGYGEDLVRAHVDGDAARFGRLLSEQVTVAELTR